MIDDDPLDLDLVEAVLAPEGWLVVRAAGGEEKIGATASFKVEPGDVLTILTPGGGGFGASDTGSAAGGSGSV